MQSIKGISAETLALLNLEHGRLSNQSMSPSTGPELDGAGDDFEAILRLASQSGATELDGDLVDFDRLSSPVPFLPPLGLPLTESNTIHLEHLVYKSPSQQASDRGPIFHHGRAFSHPAALQKLLIIPAVLTPLLISALLFWAHHTQWSAPDSVLNFTLSNRSTAQIIVQILSHVLGGMQTYVLCTLIAFGVRIRLTKKYTSLKAFKFFSAIALTRFDFALPPVLILSLVLFNVLNLGPSALWAGSLTPITTFANVSMGSIPVPNFDQESRGYWQTTSLWPSNCSTLQNTLGTFTTCPSLFTPDLFVSAAASASTPSGGMRNHTKYDNTQFAYSGRSYGVGSSVGLINPGGVNNSLEFVNKFEYTEYGYNTSVQCIYNATSAWGRELVQEGKPGNGIPDIYYALGYLPNSNLSSGVDFYSVVGLGGDSDIVAYVSKCGMNRYMYGFTAGSDYAVLDKIQCEVSYTTCEFNVVISPLEKNVVVNPVLCGGSGPDVVDVEPTGGLRCRIMVEPSISSLVSTTLYVSQIGQALLTNINNLNISLGRPSEAAAVNATILGGVGVSLTTTIDNAYGAVSSSQLLIANSTSDAPVTAVVERLVFGEARDIYAVCVMSMLIFLVVLVEAVRTRFWYELPVFNFMDVKSCVVGGALGGDDLREAIAGKLDSDVWLGDGADSRLDEVRVRLKVDAIGLSLDPGSGRGG